MTRARKRFGILVLVVAAGIVGSLAWAQPKREASGGAEQGVGTTVEGLVVIAVDPGSPAEKAGVKRGDILLKVDKIELQAPADLQFYVGRLKAGDTLTLKLSRGEAARSIDVPLGERSGRPYLGVTVEGGPGLGMRNAPDPGTAPLPWGGWGGMGSSPSVTAVDALVGQVIEGSPAAQAGIVKGDSIIKVNDASLAPGGSLTAEIAKHKPGDEVALLVRRESGGQQTITVKLGAAPDDPGKPYLGVRYQEVPVLPEGWGWGLGPRQTPFPQQPAQPGQGNVPSTRGALVIRQVADGSPAAAAGLKVGDVITAVDGLVVGPSTVLADEIGKKKPGDTVALTLTDRNGENERALTVTLAGRPDDATKAYLGVVAGGRLMLVPDDGQALPRSRGRALPGSPRRSDI